MLGLAPQVFSLSSVMLHAGGVLEACELDPYLNTQLVPVLQQKGHLVGTNSEALATVCFEWLFNRGKYVKLLEVGKACSDLLKTFAEVRTTLWKNTSRATSTIAHS